VNLGTWKDTARRFGIARGIYDLVYRKFRRSRELFILVAVVLTGESVDAAFFEKNGRFDCRFLGREEVLRFAADSRCEMSAEFVQDALDRGDECFGVLDGDVLASYGWYSNGPSRITERSDELVLRFDPRYLYMYKGYTLPAYRGERLHGLGMALALREALARGRLGLVSYIESNNFRSLRSSYRIGYRRFGSVVVGRLLGELRAVATPGCRAYAFQVEPAEREGTDPSLERRDA
jgi:hypothetical protein